MYLKYVDMTTKVIFLTYQLMFLKYSFWNWWLTHNVCVLFCISISFPREQVLILLWKTHHSCKYQKSNNILMIHIVSSHSNCIEAYISWSVLLQTVTLDHCTRYYNTLQIMLILRSKKKSKFSHSWILVSPEIWETATNTVSGTYKTWEYINDKWIDVIMI